MSKYVTVACKVPQEMKDEFFDILEEHGMDSSKWFRHCMEYYISTYGMMPRVKEILDDKEKACKKNRE